MIKHYFVSFLSFDNGNTKVGHALITVTNQSLIDIAKIIATKNNTENVSIICLKDLSDEEYKMLNGE